jgi:hypothetical protein
VPDHRRQGYPKPSLERSDDPSPASPANLIAAQDRSDRQQWGLTQDAAADRYSPYLRYCSVAGRLGLGPVRGKSPMPTWISLDSFRCRATRAPCRSLLVCRWRNGRDLRHLEDLLTGARQPRWDRLLESAGIVKPHRGLSWATPVDRPSGHAATQRQERQPSSITPA